MSKYSKGTFTHQSLRIDTATLARLQKLRQDKGIYMAQFASAAINAAIDEYYFLSNNELQAKEVWKTIFNTEPPEDFGKLV
jgi:hypothetical protein